ncbi:hypothetical protein BGZ65_012334, partial [Modicella reniformis]
VTGYYAAAGYPDPQQKQAFYPTVASPPVAAQPTPSPKFNTAEQQQQQQQHYQASVVPGNTGEYHHHPPPILMPAQSSYSPATTVISGNSTVYEPSVYQQSPGVVTVNSAAIKPAVSAHGPQVFMQPETQQPAPGNPQYVGSNNGYYH